MKTHCKHGHEYTKENTCIFKDGRTYACRKCKAIYQKQWCEKNPELWKATATKAHKKWEKKQKEKFGAHWQYEHHLKQRYGIDAKQYAILFAAQNGLCAICHQPETEIDKRTNETRSLHVDHNHDTDEIRGLLCGKCNRGIAHLKENVTSFQNAINYLTNPPARGLLGEFVGKCDAAA